VLRTGKLFERLRELDNSDEMLNKIAQLVSANTNAVSMVGARAMVLGKFLDAALPHLTPLQRAAVTQSFRQGIEDAMEHMDDVALPVEYHSTMLELTNTILAALGPESSARR
jgi:hypothetical protein